MLRFVPRPFLALLICLFATLTLLAQKPSPAIGDIDLADLTMKSCAMDASADAMYLYRSQETDVEEFSNGNHELRFKIRERIKIFNNQALKLANVRFFFLDRRQVDLVELTAYVYSLDQDGKRTIQKMGKDDIYKENETKGVTSVSFAIPNVKVGSVIEYYLYLRDRISYFLPDWNFQSEIPVQRAECRVTYPEFSRMYHRIICDIPITINDGIEKYKTGDKAFNWRTYSIENVPAFKLEPFMGSINNRYKRVELSLPSFSFRLSGQDVNSSWKAINDYFYNYYGEKILEQVPNTVKLTKQAKNFAKTIDKVSYVFNELKNTLSWNEKESLNAYDLNRTWEEKKGNSAELNVLLINLLNKCDVLCVPLLVRQREYGRIDTSFASASQFSRVVALVSDQKKYYVLDLSQSTVSPTLIPYNLVNTEAFLVSEKEGTWLRLYDDRPLFRQSLLATSTLDSNGLVKGTASKEYYDYAKDSALLAPNKGKEEEEKSKTSPDLVIQNYSREIPTDRESPIIDKFEFSYEPQSTGEFFFINPAFLTTFRNNPFTSDIRTFDIDFGSNRSLTFNMHLQIPAGFEIEELPKSVTLIKSDSGVVFKRLIGRGTNEVQCVIQLYYLQSYFPKEEYKDLQEFFKKMYGILNESIVIKKKKISS